MNGSSGNTISSTAQIKDGTIIDADINAAAAIAYSKLALTGAVVNADIAAAAAIVLSKLAAQTQGDVIIASAAGVITRLAAGTSGQFLKTNGAGADPSWGAAGAFVGWSNATVGSDMQAATDLILVIKSNGATVVKSDSASSPTVERAAVSGSIAPENICVPVKKGDYYNITNNVIYAYAMQVGS